MSATLTATVLDELKRRLAERERMLRREIEEARAAREEGRTANIGVVADRGDEANQHLQAGIAHLERERDLQELADIDEARRRMAEGTYGECIDCGRDIALERLRVQPSSLRCIACQEAREKRGPQPLRDPLDR
ncbi:TraR/DksA family transcriptional regulator [Caldimonas aquatica]|uniref:TraR/DksA family transcriptional regulator n=1 Tax=Caldimonas aquatica TaxID=376175 RepID=A0ABY6MWK0_9BURK|nr:TraR/DksA family transcriptional regulator [Schlegelella aquatica]UZD56380.1 TraR/DksA family transcriptional regulator [Schlegelella aquatica]